MEVVIFDKESNFPFLRALSFLLRDFKVIGFSTSASSDPVTNLLFFFSCFQDVVYALAHATGKTGRFTLIERWRNNERLLAPQEHPLKVNMRLLIQHQ